MRLQFWLPANGFPVDSIEVNIESMAFEIKFDSSRRVKFDSKEFRMINIFFYFLRHSKQSV